MRFLSYPVKMGLAVAVLVGICTLVPSSKASANHIGVGPFMPGFASDYLRAECGHTPQSPAMISWLSIGGWPMVTSADVAYGTPSIQLQYNSAGVVCYNNSLGTDIISEYIAGARSVTPAGSISGLVGGVMNLDWGGGAHRFAGQFRQTSIPFTYTPVGGFTASGWYTIEIDGRSMNHFASGAFACSISSGGFRSGWDYLSCPRQPQTLSVYINVLSPPVDAGSCGLSVTNGPTVEPGQQFEVNYSTTNASYNGGFAWPVNNGQPFRYRLRLLSTGVHRLGLSDEEIQGLGVQSTPFGPILYQNRTAQWARTVTAPGTPGNYTLRYRIYGYNAQDGYHYVGAVCTQTISVVERPYHKVFGGDVVAGAAFGTPCTDPNSRIIGWNHANYGAFGLSVGSGTQLAAAALNEIVDFGSGQVRNALNPAVNNRKNLTFANTIPGTFGGSLGGANMPCAPDYWNPTGAVLTGSQTIAGRTLAGGAAGNRQTIYVEGNVHITGNILFTSTNYANLDDIPSFRLIVRGNIYIAPGVSELNGLFVAIPTTASNGKIFTCSNGFGPPTIALLNGACRNPLTIYGSLVADMIKFTRTSGTLNNARPTDRMQSGAVPAERIIYTPEFWLTSDFGSTSGYDSFSGLPPVL